MARRSHRKIQPQAYPHLHVLLLADDFGAEMWPLVRRQAPACLAPVGTDGTESVLSVLAPIAAGFSSYPLHVVTTDEMSELVRFELIGRVGLDAMDLDIIKLPFCHESAFSVALACSCIRRDDPDALVLVIPASQPLEDADRWEALVYRAFQTALRGQIVLFAADEKYCPSGADYLKVGKQFSNIEGCFEVRSLTCGAKLSVAQRAVRDGALWYTGMFLARLSLLLGALAGSSDPIESLEEEKIGRIAETASFFAAIDKASWSSEDARLVIETLPKISIEQAAFMQADNLVALPADVEVRLLRSLEDVGASGMPDRFGNRCIGPAFDAGSTNTTVVEQEQTRLVCTCGLEDTLVVDMADMVLVADKRSGVDVSSLIERMRDAHVPQLDVPARRTFSWGVATLASASGSSAVWRLEIRAGQTLAAQSVPCAYRGFIGAAQMTSSSTPRDGGYGAYRGRAEDIEGITGAEAAEISEGADVAETSEGVESVGGGEGTPLPFEMYSVVSGFVVIARAADGVELDIKGPGECFSADSAVPIRIQASDEGSAAVVLVAARSK